ncbi:hypothetical protein Trydic_g22940 [Trypoxylus dichotomus]
MRVSIESYKIQQTIRSTNWQTFEKNLKLRPTHINIGDDIDSAVKQFEEDIILVLDSAITMKLKIPRENIPNYIRGKVHQKKFFYKQYKRTLHPNGKTLSNIRNEISKDLAEHYNDHWDVKIEKMNDDDAELWKITKTLKTKTFRSNPPVDSNHETFTDVINEQVDPEYANIIIIQETATEELQIGRNY